MLPRKLFLTGASGFLGSALLYRLTKNARQYEIKALTRQEIVSAPSIQTIIKPVLDSTTDLTDDLQGVDVVVHCAARAHIMNDTAQNPLEEFRKVNTRFTVSLARQSASADVKRFVFISSVKVNGEVTSGRTAFCEEETFESADPYAISKHEAEESLWQISRSSGMDVVIIRPPVVYGPNVKGNFASMMKWVRRGVPLPLGAVNNRRSLIALDNLTDFITCCIEHPQAANETFLISDGADISTTELLQKMANAFGVKSRLFPVPVGWMRLAATFLGRKAVSDRLFGSLQIDSSKAREILGWRPVITMDEQFAIIAKSFNR